MSKELKAWFTVDELNAWADKKLKENPKWAEQPTQQQEPVAWIWKYANGEEEVVFVPPRHVDATHVDAPSTITPLYTTPPQRKPLTDEEINQIADEFIVNYRIPAGSHYDFARSIEAAHGIKE